MQIRLAAHANCLQFELRSQESLRRRSNNPWQEKTPSNSRTPPFGTATSSLLATRMRSEDIMPFMERMDQMGYFALEVWGGATFDTTHRFLGDDPWERIRIIKGILKKTPTRCCSGARTWWAIATTPTI